MFLSIQWHRKKKMLYQDAIKLIYRNILGENIKKEILIRQLKHKDISEIFGDGFDDPISESHVGKIIKGKCNLTSKSLYAFMSTFNYRNPLELLFPDDVFCQRIIIEICKAILNENIFDNTLLKNNLQFYLNNKYSKITDNQFKQIDMLVKENSYLLLISLKNFFGAFPKEETSDQVACKLSDWLSEFGCLITYFINTDCQLSCQLINFDYYKI